MAEQSNPRSSADHLARAYLDARTELRKASRILHDDVGSLLAVAGLRLQLLRMDHPQVGDRAGEVSEALDGVMETIRTLSQQLDPSPAGRTGLKNALIDLGQQVKTASNGQITIRCSSTAVLPGYIADAIYDVARLALRAALDRKGVRRITISAAGSKTVAVRIADDGQASRRSRNLELAALLARHAGLTFEVATRKGTIVSIRYAVQRSARR